MPFEYKGLEIKKIPLKDLVMGRGQVRKHHVSKDISELADSIRVVGQLQPIVVCQSLEQSNKFEILTGQRRFLACKELGQDDRLGNNFGSSDTRSRGTDNIDISNYVHVLIPMFIHLK